MGTTRFSKGVTNIPQGSTLGTYLAMDPTKIHEFFSDYDTYAAGDYTVTATGAGTAAAASGDGGLLAVTTSGTSADNVFMQLTNGTFLLDATKRAWFKARIKVDNIATVQLFAGLQSVTTTPLTATDGIYFIKTNAGTSLDVIVRKNTTTGSTSQTGQVALVNDTFVDIGWYYDGADKVLFYANGAQIGTFTTVSAYFPDAILTPSFGIQTGAAATRLLTVDYVFAAKER